MSRSILPAAPDSTSAGGDESDGAPDRAHLDRSGPAVRETPGARRRLVVAVLPAALYLGVRAMGTLMLWGMTALQHRSLNLHPWDGDWYLKIAEHGYAAASAGMFDTFGPAHPDAAMAFFPGYPLLVHLLAPIAGHSYLAAGLTVSTTAGVAAAYGVARLAHHFGGRRRAELLAVALVAGAPMAVVYTLPYPTALLVALSAWTLIAVLEHRWWLAAPLALAAGLVEPMAAPVFPAVILAAVVDVYRGRAPSGALVAAGASPAGMFGYLLWVRQTSSVPGGYFEISRAGWGTHIDFGVTAAKWIFGAFTGGRDTFVVLTGAAIVAACVGLAAAWRRMPWPVSVYTAATLALIVMSGGLIQDRVRLLLSVFPLLIAAAVRLDGARRATALAALAVLTGLWFGAYALTVWPYGI